MECITVKTTLGDLQVPALFKDGCEGLAVTMTQFGLYEVTHVNSGLSLSGKFERAINAIADMFTLRIALFDAGINPLDDAEKFKKSISECTEKFEVTWGLTILGWLTTSKQTLNLAGEFPWESGEDDPFVQAEELEKMLMQKMGSNKAAQDDGLSTKAD